MRLSLAIDDYCHVARYELNHSKATYYCYSARLKQFAAWLDSQGHADPPVSSISYEIIRRYHLHNVATGVRPRTLRSHIHALRALLGYLVSQGVLTENAATTVRMPKLDATNRKLVSDEDLLKLLESAGRQRTDFRCVRDTAVLSVLIFCALRRQELLDLRVADVNLDNAVLVVQCGKGSKSRQVPLCKEVHQALSDWLALRRTLKTKTDKLFSIAGGRPLGDEAFSRLIADAAASSGLRGEERVQPHSIRHAAASRLLRNGMSIKGVSTWLGHSELRTTAIYLHTSEQELQSLAALASFQKPQEDRTEAVAPSRGDRSAFFQSRRRTAVR